MLSKEISSIVLNFGMTRPGIGPGNRGSIEGRVIAKPFKMVLDTSLLNTLHYKVRIKDKSGVNPGKWVAPSSTPRCSSCKKRESSDRPRLQSPTYFIWCNRISTFLGYLTTSPVDIYFLFVIWRIVSVKLYNGYGLPWAADWRYCASPTNNLAK